MGINTFLFMGRPGSGKGMQAKMLADKTGYKIFSTGAKLREISQETTDLGKKVGMVINSGALMPSWFVSHLFEEVLMATPLKEGIIFEGVGRKVHEVEQFSESAEWFGRDFRIVYLDVSEKNVTERLHKRQDIEGRKDDDPRTLQARFDNYREHTVLALEAFRSMGKVIDINGEPPPEEVFAQIWDKVSRL